MKITCLDIDHVISVFQISYYVVVDFMHTLLLTLTQCFVIHMHPLLLLVQWRGTVWKTGSKNKYQKNQETNIEGPQYLHNC